MRNFILGIIVGSVLTSLGVYAQQSLNPDFYGRPQWGQQITPPQDAYGRPNVPQNESESFWDQQRKKPC